MFHALASVSIRYIQDTVYNPVRIIHTLRIIVFIVYIIKGIGILASHDSRRGGKMDQATPLINIESKKKL
jgi:hypothetical protein